MNLVNDKNQMMIGKKYDLRSWMGSICWHVGHRILPSTSMGTFGEIGCGSTRMEQYPYHSVV